MPNLASDVKSLLIELSSGSKYEYIIGLNTGLAKIAYSVLNMIYPLLGSWNDSLWSFKVLMLLGVHVQTFECAKHMYEEGGRHLALAWTLT